MGQAIVDVVKVTADVGRAAVDVGRSIADVGKPIVDVGRETVDTDKAIGAAILVESRAVKVGPLLVSTLAEAGVEHSEEVKGEEEAAAAEVESTGEHDSPYCVVFEIDEYSPNYKLPPPDPSVTKFEDEVISRQTEKERDSCLLECKLPVRPAYGKAGKTIVLRTNYFELKLSKANQQLYRYDVSFDPDKKTGDSNTGDKISNGKKRQYMELLLQDPMFGKHCATDYSSIIISNQPLNLSSKTFQRFIVVRWDRYEVPFPATPSPGESTGRRNARQRRRMTLEVKFNQTYTVRELFDFVRSSQPGATYTASKDIVQAMNIVFARAPHFHRQIVKVGQNKFYPFHDRYVGRHDLEQVHELGQTLQALRGAYSSIRLGPSRVLVNINVACGAFFKEGLLSDLMMAVLPHSSDLQNRFKLKQMEKLLKGLRVITTYTKSEEKTAEDKAKTVQKVHTIYSLAEKPRLGANSREVKFSTRDEASGQEQMISVEEYFKSHHNIHLKAPVGPVVNVGSKNEPVYLPPEICYVHGGQPARTILSPAQTAEMIRFAARPPNFIAQSVEGPSLKIFQVSDAEQKDSIGQFGLQQVTQMLTVPARVLPPVPITFNRLVTPIDGQWNLRGVKFYQGARMGKFSGLEIRGQNRQPLTGNFGATFAQVVDELKRYGMQIEDTLRPSNPITVPGPHDSKNWAKIASQVDNALKELAVKGVKWLLVSIPEENSFLYSAIKTPADTKYGIQTVVIQDKNAAKINQSQGQHAGRSDLGLVANLALKFCGKAGGTCWALDRGGLEVVGNDTMLVGLDVTHPSPGSRESAPSVAAIVASVDQQLSSWPGNLCVQKGGQEMVEKLTELMVERLRLWQKKHKNELPKKIIMFRDGVSEGQFSKVLNTEYPSMVKAFDQVYGQRSRHPLVSISVSTTTGSQG